MLELNGVQWYIKFVQSYDKSLVRPNGTLTIGMCDSYTRTIYINETLQGAILKKVLCHELTHAAMFSYGILLSHDEEEILADLIATYGEEIIYITNKIFNKLKGRDL